MVNLKILFPIVICMGFLAGCAKDTKPEQYKEVYVATYIVPTPPKVDRPVLYSTTMTEQQKDDLGELAKAFNIDRTQLKQYACVLEKIIDKYAELSKTSTKETPTVVLTEGDKSECLKK